MQSENELSPVEILALSKIIPDKLAKVARKKVGPGRRTGTITVKIDYDLERLPDTDTPSRVGVSNVMSILSRIAGAQLESDVADDLIERVERAINRRKAKRIPQAGQTTVTATISPVAIMTAGEPTVVVAGPTPAAPAVDEKAVKTARKGA